MVFALLARRTRMTSGRHAALRPAIWFSSFFLAAVAATLAPAAAFADEERSARENRFGVEVAGRGLWQEAVYRWERAAVLDPDNHKALNNLAVAYERAGRFEEALDAYENALELEPGSEHVRQNYELFREAYERKKRKDRDAQRSSTRP